MNAYMTLGTSRTYLLPFTTNVDSRVLKKSGRRLEHPFGAMFLVYGMKNGSFTANGLTSTNRLSKYFPLKPGNDQWEAARKIVNGTFQAEKVAFAAGVMLSCIYKESEFQADQVV